MRYILAVILTLALLFAVSTASLATPMTAADGGHFMIFGDWNGWWEDFTVGAGYGLTDSFTVGGMYAIYYGQTGVFANLTFAPIIVQADFWFPWWTPVVGKVTGLYAFDLDPITLGIGGGVEFPSPYVFLEADLNLAVSDGFDLYGSAGCRLDGSWYWFKGGVALEF